MQALYAIGKLEVDKNLSSIYEHMLELGKASLAHANWHSNYVSAQNSMWPQLSVLQAAHAAEIFIKARIAQEHPLLIFDQIPKSSQVKEEFLDFKHLLEKAKTIQYAELPERLWSVTGIKLKNLEIYKNFGFLRNSIQHFATPKNVDCEVKTKEFIFKVIDPLIYECWGLCAVDFNEDTDPYVYFVEDLIRQSIEFLVSEELAKNFDNIEKDWPSEKYKKLMLKRFRDAGCLESGI